MRKVLLSLAGAVAVGTLAACGSDPVVPAPVVVTPPAATSAPVVVAPGSVGTPVVIAPAHLRAGMGRVESIAYLPRDASAAAGGSREGRRLGIRMDDGTVQFVDTPATSLELGDRVELTGDGSLRRM